MKEKVRAGKFLGLISKLLLSVTLLMIIFTSLSKSADISTKYLIDLNYISAGDTWLPRSESYADARVSIAGTAKLPEGGNTWLSIYGGEFNYLDFNDGCMTLSTDLVITGSIGIWGDHAISGTITTDGTGSKIIYLSKNQSLSNHVTFTGTDLLIDADGSLVNFESTGTFSVGLGANQGVFTTLTLRDMVLSNLHNQWLYLEDGNHDNNYPQYSQTSTVSFDNVTFDYDPYTEYVQTSTNNIMAFIGDENMFNAGFTLPNNITLATKYPFSGTLNFNDLLMTLYEDLYFTAEGLITGNGTVAADSDAAERTMFFNRDITFENILSFSSSITVDGNGYTFDLNSLGKFTVGNGKTLTLKNMTIKNLPAGWVAFGSSSSWLNFDNVRVLNPHNITINQWDQIYGDVEYFEHY